MQTTEIAVIAQNIETGLSSFEKRKDELLKKVSGYDSLDIKDHADKAGYSEVSAARKSLKAERVQIEKEGKSMRDPLTAMSKFVIEKENELVAITEPAEKRLSEKEKWYEAENDRIKREAEELEAARIQNMADQLAAYNFPFVIEQLKAVTDAQFNEALLFAKEAFEKKEAERVALEKAETERKEAEAAQLKKDREELARLREQQEETARKQAEAQQKIDAENKRITDEKEKLEREHQQRIADEKRALELEEAKQLAAETARLQVIAAAKLAEERKAEAARKAQAAAERKARLAPDKDKLLAFAERLPTLIDFEVKSAEANSLVFTIQNDLKSMRQLITNTCETL